MLISMIILWLWPHKILLKTNLKNIFEFANVGYKIRTHSRTEIRLNVFIMGFANHDEGN